MSELEHLSTSLQLVSFPLRGSDLRVLGIHVHSYRKTPTECFAICAAASDCAAFVDFRQQRFCQFKRSGGKVARDSDTESDLFLRLSEPVPPPPPPVPPLPLSSPPPLPPKFHLEPLVKVPSAASADQEHRIFQVQRFVSASEAGALRKFAAACFKRGAATQANVTNSATKNLFRRLAQNSGKR